MIEDHNNAPPGHTVQGLRKRSQISEGKLVSENSIFTRQNLCSSVFIRGFNKSSCFVICGRPESAGRRSIPFGFFFALRSARLKRFVNSCPFVKFVSRLFLSISV